MSANWSGVIKQYLDSNWSAVLGDVDRTVLAAGLANRLRDAEQTRAIVSAMHTHPTDSACIAAEAEAAHDESEMSTYHGNGSTS